MAMLTREALLKKGNFRIERVDLDEGDYCFVRQMSGRERDQFESSMLIEKTNEQGDVSYERSMGDFRAKLASCTVCDEQGNLLLDITDAATLSQSITAARLELIVNKAQEMNKITQKDKDNLVKNSAADRSGDSTSGSVENSDSRTPITSSES